MEVLRTQRLIIRTWSDDDESLALKLWGDPDVSKFIFKAPLSREEVVQIFRRQLEFQVEYGFQYWIIERLNDRAFVGACGLRPWVFCGNTDDVELGFHICKDQWHHGFAAETARAVIDFSFHCLGIKKIFAGHHPDNLASRHILLHLGFSPKEMVLYPPTGLMHPTYELLCRV